MTGVQRQVRILNKLGLHARAATQLARLVNQFDAEVTLLGTDKEANASSVLGLMMLESHQGQTLTVRADGSDAMAALDAVCALFEERFNEPQ